MLATTEQYALDFYTYPPVGSDDWRYVFQTAQVRTIEMEMLSKASFLDMANAENFQAAAELLAPTEYAMPATLRDIEEMQLILRHRRTAIRRLFEVLMLDKPIVELFRTRNDFANLRLAVRRILTDRAIGSDYSDEGNLPREAFEPAFAEENHESFPDYMKQAADQATLAFYQNKDIRQIDYSIDRFQAQYNLNQARRLKSIFLLNLFRIQIDLTNIRTMFRLKFTESQQRNVFLEGGFLNLERLQNALDADYEAAGQLFFVTPHYRIIETGANYLVANKSFLALEQQCEQYLTGYLKSTVQITAGPQPIIAYLLLKENEIRSVRLILTAKKNSLSTKLILDRLGE